MVCPNPTCKSKRLIVRESRSGFDEAKVPDAYKSLNIIRRSRTCLRCGGSFFSIEMIEKDFQMLRDGKRDFAQEHIQTARPVRS